MMNRSRRYLQVAIFWLENVAEKASYLWREELSWAIYMCIYVPCIQEHFSGLDLDFELCDPRPAAFLVYLIAELILGSLRCVTIDWF